MYMLKVIVFVISILTPFFIQANNEKQAQLVANQIVTKLYQTNGNFLIPKPNVEVLRNVSNVARLLRQSNIIELDYQTYTLCQAMGKDSSSALAFILGHELAHVFQLDALRNEASFLSYTKNNKFVKEEQQADLYGAFLAHLSGFKTHEILPQLIDQIYVKYDLKNKSLPNYPTFEERQQIGKQLAQMIVQMQQCFETANYATVAGEYELAIHLFEGIELNYKGKELYNNLGVAYTLLALSIQKTNQDAYVYPLELDASLRLKKPKISRGDEDIAEKKKVDKYFKKASTYLEQAAKMDMQYLTPNINMVCIMLLQNKPKDAVSYIAKKQMEKRARFSSVNSLHLEKIKLIKALALIKTGVDYEPRQILIDLANHQNKSIADIARYDLKVFSNEGIKIDTSVVSTCGLSSEMPSNITLYKLPKIANWIDISNEYAISTTEKEGGLQVFVKQNKKLCFSFFRKNEMKTTVINEQPNSLVFTSDGTYVHCSEQQQIVLQGDQNSYIQYYKTINPQ